MIDAIDSLLSTSTHRGEVEALHAAWLDTPHGPMLALATDQALVLLEFLQRRGLESAVERLARSATITRGLNGPLESVAHELGEYFAGRLDRFATPLAPRGSEFQRGVWRELRRIPAGATISYLELATAVGNPKGFRAVAQANGANRLAVVVPCHRVINADGALGGYGAGLPLKRALLEHERAAFGGAAVGRLF